MKSNRPYLLRAFYEWIVDSACTPILAINANDLRCKIPRNYVEDGEIVFNVSPKAARDFIISNELVEFKASFSGVVHIISAPIQAIVAIYAEENNEGIFFDADEQDEQNVEDIMTFDQEHLHNVVSQDKQCDSQSVDKAAKKDKPVLRLVE